MADLSESISAILNDPSAMQRLQETAATLFGEKETEKPNKSDMLSQLLGDKAPSGGANIGEIGALMNVVNMLKSSPCDSRVALLTALKPHLSEKRRQRVNKAVKMLRLVSLVPLLREQGVLNDLF